METAKAHASFRICMARSQPLLFVRNGYGPRETYKHKLEAVYRFIDCLKIFFSKIYLAIVYHYAAQVYLSGHQILVNTPTL